MARGAKALVVACNTASGAALDALRECLPLPVIGTEPAVKPAVRSSRSHRIGVIATTATATSHRLARLLQNHCAGASMVVQPCPGLADLVEAGETDGEQVRQRLQELLAPLRAAEVDTVVLGCTHYPFVRDAIQEVMGPEVELVDSGAAVARQTERVLRERDLLAQESAGGFVLLTTGDIRAVGKVARRLWGETLDVERIQEVEGGSSQRRSTGGAPVGGSSR
jgi:glutamate racemase